MFRMPSQKRGIPRNKRCGACALNFFVVIRHAYENPRRRRSGETGGGSNLVLYLRVFQNRRDIPVVSRICAAYLKRGAASALRVGLQPRMRRSTAAACRHSAPHAEFDAVIARSKTGQSQVSNPRSLHSTKRPLQNKRLPDSPKPSLRHPQIPPHSP